MVDKFNFPDGTKRMIRKHALADLLPPGARRCRAPGTTAAGPAL